MAVKNSKTKQQASEQKKGLGKTQSKGQGGKSGLKFGKSAKDRKDGFKLGLDLEPGKYGKTGIIVLAVCAVVFIAAILWIYSGPILNGEENIFWIYGDERIDFNSAVVKEITKDDKRQEKTDEGAYTGSQELSVVISGGHYKGRSITAYNYFGPLSGVPVKVGDSVMLTIKTHTDGEISATVYELNRIPVIAVFIVLFFVVVAIVGGRTGVKSLVGLIITMVCLFAILIPLLVKGAPTIFTTFVVCAFVAMVSFVILGGVHRKTVSAFLGTMAGALLAMLFGMAVQAIARIDGFRLDSAEPLLQLKYVGGVVRIKGLLVAGIVVSALGAVMDVAMSISSALEEVHAANPSLSAKELFRSGMNIGRDMVGTMTNTLILAFLGSQFSLIIFLFARNMTFNHLASTAFIALETISGISASIGMVLAIPLTTLIASTLIVRKK